MTQPVDVLIVGSGASGAAVAWSLAETKMHIVCLEQGDWMKPSEYPSAGRDWEARQLSDFHYSPNRRARDTDYLMPDVTWTGGITELKKIATLAETFYIPVSPHDASGPINVVAGAHVMMSTPNFYRLETSRWDLSGYNAFITTPLDNSGGRLKLPPQPGLGIEMDMEFLRGNVVDGFGGI